MTIFETIAQEIKEYDLKIASFDFERPWGGFFVIEEEQVQKFADIYFDGLNVTSIKLTGRLSPKILLVKPGSRLSWQYHHRRAETWRVIYGPVGVIKSFDDIEGAMNHYNSGEIIVLKKGERHRLVGLKNWGIVAEFWQHTDANYPSNEEDIVRIQDDYYRK